MATKNFCLQTGVIKKMKNKTNQMWDKIFINNISDKRFISRIFK